MSSFFTLSLPIVRAVAFSLPVVLFAGALDAQQDPFGGQTGQADPFGDPSAPDPTSRPAEPARPVVEPTRRPEQADADEAQLPEIPDEPKLIDPATVIPAKLAARATVDLTDSSLSEVVQWLRDEQGLVVLLDQGALADAGILAGEPVSDRLDDSPIYLLLNRLRSLDLAWYYEDDILHITSGEVAQQRMSTVPYNLGDLLDAGYESDRLGDVIQSAIEPPRWESVGGEGALSFLGDVMFVRHTDGVHRQVEGLLAALRKHARQTFVLDPPRHLVLRGKLDENVTVDYQDTPLDSAIGELAGKLGIDIRLDLPALREIRVRERQPVTLRLSERKLRTVLHALVGEYGLTWILRDGVLCITSRESAESFLKTAVHDVRDLCRDDSESTALREAVISQTTADQWDDNGGPGAIVFAKPGTMVVHHREDMLMQVLELLETYRTALRESRPRDRDKVDPQEVVTVYYRLHANVAQDLLTMLPVLIRPDSWRSPVRPDARGQIHRVASPPELYDMASKRALVSGAEDASALVVSRAVLIIRQTRETHDDIAEIIRRVQSGDAAAPSGFGGGGFGGGGFGGGFFSIPSTDRTP